MVHFVVFVKELAIYVTVVMKKKVNKQVDVVNIVVVDAVGVINNKNLNRSSLTTKNYLSSKEN